MMICLADIVDRAYHIKVWDCCLWDPPAEESESVGILMSWDLRGNVKSRLLATETENLSFWLSGDSFIRNDQLVLIRASGDRQEACHLMTINKSDRRLI